MLESYPRDELFQIAVPTLRKHAEAVLGLVERPRVRALYRVDQFDRFVSVIVFVPRDRYDSVVREKIGAYLKTAFEGRLSAYYPAFPEGSLARVHFIIGRSGGRTPKVEQAAIEETIRDIIRTWEDALREAAVASGADASLLAVAARFPESYRGSFTRGRGAARCAPRRGNRSEAADRHRLLPPRRPAAERAALKIYHHGKPVALSRRVPVLENIGFKVISERTFEVGGGPDGPVFIHDMELENAFGAPIDLSDNGKLFEEVFLSVWRREADNDGYNALAQTAGLGASAIGILRAYGRYLQQAGIPQSQGFIAAVLNRYPDIARGLHGLFVARLDPAAGKEGEVTAKHLEAKIKDALEDVPNIDDDTIIRRYLNLIEASLRTNHFVPALSEKGQSLAIKLDSRLVDGLPEPRPWREIFVYGSEVEGVHLRFGPVARGGLRWSDRAQDYRTEVLGLVKAQQVKNAVIVPVGAKGGFYPKRSTTGFSRDQIFEAGRNAYVNFVSSLLSVTDNIEGSEVVPPENVVRRDQDDPYFVVAADKGTATFSDTANAISQKHGFWLDDAFASRRLGRLRPQEDGHHRQGRMGGGEAAFPRDEPGHPDDALHRRRRRRHVGRRVRQRHAAVRPDAADRRLRPSRHLHRSGPGPGRYPWPSASACSRCRVRAGRTTTSRSCPRAAPSSRAARNRSRSPPPLPRRSAWQRPSRRRSRS